ncbi:MAG TPA: proton-conducting transporter membrane subunit, partial [Polyangiaceae bacterium]|nr:proton-conducting transporter membrane subunit [Polyangiaceae bacterium]
FVLDLGVLGPLTFARAGGSLSAFDNRGGDAATPAMPEFTGPVQHVELSTTLWLIPLMPLLGCVINLFFGRKLQASGFGQALAKKLHVGSFGVSLVAIGAMLAAFALSIAHVAKVISLPHEARYLYCHAWQMVRIGSVEFNFDFGLDPLSSVMILIITGIGSLIHIYAAAYMATEKAYWRFFTYLNLFVFSMLLLVLGDGFMVMFFGWEGVGLCSYLLIGFWYEDYQKASAGMKAFVTNRVGDWGFVVGLMLIFWGLGGSWLSGGFYQPDNLARLSVVTVEEGGHAAHEEAGHALPHAEAGHEAPSPKSGPAYLTFTAFPGAEVYLDNAQTPLARSPFVKREVKPGHHAIRVVPGGGVDDQEIPAALTPAGTETVVAVVGPTLVFRQLHDQLVMKDNRGQEVLREALTSKTVWGGISLVTLACICFFIGATGKSAQIPLYVWLPDAMAGPTPVSALIHAATMVTAGVYMIARMSWLFSLSSTASAVVALTGATTALFAASIGFFQYDIKKVLAYSTVSQLGFMFIGVGVGAYWAGVFHLITHAFFKACLFLGSGSVIHGMHGVEHDPDAAQDMRNMGGLKRVMPLTAKTYFIACLAITAAPFPLFAGFWSKDEILWKAFNTENIGAVPGVVVYLMGLTAAVGTSFYMWRSYFLTFEGDHAKPEIATKVHESPAAMTYVLAFLAFLSTVAGALFGFSTHLTGGHGEPLLEEWLHPVLAHAEVHFIERPLGFEFALMALSVGLATGAYLVAKRRYGAGRAKDWATNERALPLFDAIQNKYWVDEVYQATIIGWALKLRLVLADMDRWVVDGLVNGAGVAGRGCAWVSGAIDHYLVDGLVNIVAEGTLSLGGRLRKVQTGRIQSYVYGLLGGVAFFSILQYFLAK